MNIRLYGPVVPLASGLLALETAAWIPQGAVSLHSLNLALGGGLLAYTAFSLGGKALARQWRRRSVATLRRVLVVGSRADAQVYLNSIESSFELVQVVGFLDTRGGCLQLDGHPLAANMATIAGLFESLAVDEVVVAGVVSPVNADDLARTCIERGVVYRSLVKIPAPDFGRCTAVALERGNYLLSIETVPQAKFPLALKRAIDIVGALVGLLFVAVGHALFGRRIRSETGGSALFMQTRVGRNGRRFRLFKFRSMSVDAESCLSELGSRNEMAGHIFKMRDDPRVTPLGRFLRRHHLDELPQFWNVLCGEMSLVGTRPPTPAEVERYLPCHWRRLSMKPGLTGSWQLRGNGQVSDFEQIVRLDCEYIDNWSILLDLKIIAKTLMVVINGNGW